MVVFDFLDPEWLRLTRCADPPDRSVPGSLLIGMSGEFEQFLSAVNLGVTGYLLREASTEEVLAAVRLIARGIGCLFPGATWMSFQYVYSTSKCRPVHAHRTFHSYATMKHMFPPSKKGQFRPLLSPIPGSR